MKIFREYQKNALRYTMDVQHPALLMEMRLGKTLVAIRRVKLYRDARSVLVLAPYSALGSWWEDLTDENENFTKLYGSREKRLDDLQEFKGHCRRDPEERRWVVTNKDIYLSVPEIVDWRWDVVIVDESTTIKNPPGGRGKKTGDVAVDRAREPNITKFFLSHFRSAKHRFILTGTLMPESPLDAYCQLKFLSDDMWDEKSFYQFRMRHFEVRGFDWVVKKDSLPYIQSVLNRNTFMLTRAQVDLTGVKVYEKVMVNLPDKMREVYRTIEEKFVFEIDGVEEDSTIYATQSYIWLRRICGGFDTTGTAVISDHKEKALKTLLDGDLKGQQVIIWARFVSEVRQIAEILDCPYIAGNIDPQHRERLRRGFQDGRHQYLSIQPETMKMGAKFSAADALVYYSTPESGTTRQQSEDRSIDVESRKGALIIDMQCIDTVEEDISFDHIKKIARSEVIASVVRNAQRRMREGK